MTQTWKLKANKNVGLSIGADVQTNPNKRNHYGLKPAAQVMLSHPKHKDWQCSVGTDRVRVARRYNIPLGFFSVRGSAGLGYKYSTNSVYPSFSVMPTYKRTIAVGASGMLLSGQKLKSSTPIPLRHDTSVNIGLELTKEDGPILGNKLGIKLNTLSPVIQL